MMKKRERESHIDQVENEGGWGGENGRKGVVWQRETETDLRLVVLRLV